MSESTDTTVDICKSCKNNGQPCLAEFNFDIEFGNGYGHDNIIKCSGYEPLA